MPIRRTHQSPEEASLQAGAEPSREASRRAAARPADVERGADAERAAALGRVVRPIRRASSPDREAARHQDQESRQSLRARGRRAGRRARPPRARGLVLAHGDRGRGPRARAHGACRAYAQRRRRIERRSRDQHAPAQRARARTESNRVHARDARARSHDRHRAGRHRQDLSRRCGGRRGAVRGRRAAHRARAPGGGSRRAPRLPAGRHVAEDRSVPAADVRRALRDDGLRPRRHGSSSGT